MDGVTLAIMAIKLEAAKKPDEKVIIGEKVMTFKKAAELAEKGDKLVMKFLVEPYVEMLRDPEFKAKILKTLGFKQWKEMSGA